MLMTQAQLKELLHYDPDTGVFRWRKNTGRAKAGAIAGVINAGYRMIKVRKRSRSAHRLAFFYMNGKWPEAEIDHVNNNKDDNRMVNLRQASRAENMRNARRFKNNTSGFKGVSWHKVTGKWAARIYVDGKRLNIGLFASKHEAALALKAIRERHHGEFANHG
jgi:hypothetical protein